jgi:signal transduction histidine kinase
MPKVHLGLFDTPPTRTQARFARIVVGLMIASMVLIFPVSDMACREVDSFLPTMEAFVLLGELITAALLYAQATVFRSQALIVLATGYLFDAILLVPHALTFPGAFAPDGMLGGGPNATIWIGIARQVGFAIAVIGYVLLKRSDRAARPEGREAAGIAGSVLAAIALSAAVTLAATLGYSYLPAVHVHRAEVSSSGFVLSQFVMFALHLAAAVMLWRARNSVLDMWLLVATAFWALQALLNMTLSHRFTIGWYGYTAMTLFSQLIVMFALLAESNLLYARLASSMTSRARDREARLMSMDAATAAISHEVGQPLTAVIANAAGALSCLNRVPPDIGLTEQALRATLDAGHRTFDVIKSIRAMFVTEAVSSTEVDLNDLVRETASLLGRELAGVGAVLDLALDEALPPVLANRVQLQRVLVNLFSNAIDALEPTRGRPRRIAVRSATLEGGEVLLEMSDNGIGIDAANRAHIFESFFTTKPTGTGLGLSLCRIIVEEHGGRLWASHEAEHGVTFHLQLPAATALPQPEQYIHA